MSATNARRHEKELTIKANDLITGKDCLRIVQQAMIQYLEIDEKDRQAKFDKLPWWRRWLRGYP